MGAIPVSLAHSVSCKSLKEVASGWDTLRWHNIRSDGPIWPTPLSSCTDRDNRNWIWQGHAVGHRGRAGLELGDSFSGFTVSSCPFGVLGIWGRFFRAGEGFLKNQFFGNFPFFFSFFSKTQKVRIFFILEFHHFRRFSHFSSISAILVLEFEQFALLFISQSTKKIDNFEGFSFFLVISPFYERWYQRVSGAPRILSPVISRNQVAKLNILRREARRAGILRDRGCRRGAVGVFFDENHKIKVNLKDFRYFHFL